MRCSYCHTRGHNKSTCPSRMLEIRDNPQGRAAREYRAAKASRLMKNRQCSYCKSHGHTRRTCQFFKDDVKKLSRANIQWREYMLEGMRSLGLAPGALLKVSAEQWSAGGYRTIERLVLVKNIDWNSLHFGAALRRTRLTRKAAGAIKGRYVDGIRDQWSHSDEIKIPLPYIEHIDDDGKSHPLTRTQASWGASTHRRRTDSLWEIVSPLTEEIFNLHVDQSFLNEESAREIIIGYMNESPTGGQKKRDWSTISWNLIGWADYSEIEGLK